MFLYFNSKRKENKIATFSETHKHDILYLNSTGILKQNKPNIFRQNCFSFIFGYERSTRLIKKNYTKNDLLYFNNTVIPKQYKTQTFKQTNIPKIKKEIMQCALFFSNKIKIFLFLQFWFCLETISWSRTNNRSWLLLNFLLYYLNLKHENKFVLHNLHKQNKRKEKKVKQNQNRNKTKNKKRNMKTAFTILYPNKKKQKSKNQKDEHFQ